MDKKQTLEGQLREAACIGDSDYAQELINLGVDINSRHSINGWTPLHWACKRNNFDVVSLLLQRGANPNIKSEKGESPAAVCSNPKILEMLGVIDDLEIIDNEQESYSFTPNYLKNPPLNPKLTFVNSKDNYSYEAKDQSYEDDLILKVRIADAEDPDFIEIDLPPNCLTYNDLLQLCCNELNVNSTSVRKIRKLPNTKLRRDKDIQRLQNFQELEVVLSLHGDNSQMTATHLNGNIPTVATNNYQSISKKDQTILY